MRKFTFKALQNFFGDRGLLLKRGDFKKWGVTDKYIWWVPNNEKCDSYFSNEYIDVNKDIALYVAIKDMYCEIQDENYLDVILKEIEAKENGSYKDPYEQQ